MDVQKYLNRIGSLVPAEPDLDALRSLHTRHLLSVPFEDLTVHSGGRVELDLPLIYDKIVTRRRGGLCYENNGLFSWLLSSLGFQVTMLSAQVKGLITGFYGPPFDHLVLLVTLQGRRWLCDVGYGAAGFSVPISLETSGPQVEGHRVYRIRKQGDVHFLEWQGVENTGADGVWKEILKFTLDPRRLEDFTDMCQYHQSSPCSLIFSKSLCVIMKPGRWLTCMGRRLISTTFTTEGAGFKTTTRELQDEEITVILAEEFGIVLNSPLTPKDETITPPPVMY
ncbi:arylamine N-acetyltransferase, pineal gland isozyme NAT-3-like [Limanda limanda]|uniref:arylamine N-acetyltransferase, pineal gland isozyme NAT-3-like n=1 Tax=Limanda limanda TaxID=27771 RepID=UPI0029C9620C|nr:arylamine N-acetyltransferase, pineal gland isozyme NAT-3-like [Limanda limanda]